MKKIILTMVALLSMTAMMAQNDKKEGKAHKQPTAEEMVERMAKELNLTDDQKAKVLELNKEYKDVMRGPGMGRGPRGGRGPRQDAETGATQQQRPERPQLTDEQKAEMKKNMEKRKEYDAKLKNILTEDQYKKLQKQRHHGGHHGGKGGKRPADAPQD